MIRIDTYMHKKQDRSIIEEIYKYLVFINSKSHVQEWNQGLNNAGAKL